MSDTDNNSSDKGGLMIFCKILLNMAIHKMIGMVVYQVINAASVGSSSFHMHAIYCVIGYQLLLVDGIMSFNNETSWVRNIPVKIAKLVHLFLGLVGGVFSFLGVLLIVVSEGGVKFQTAHGVCGLIALIFSLLSVFNGFLTYFSSQLKLKPANIKAVHTVCGIGSIIMGLVTLCIGINKDIFSVWVGDNTYIVSLLTAFVIIILLHVLWHPVISIVGYIKNMKTSDLR